MRIGQRAVVPRLAHGLGLAVVIGSTALLIVTTAASGVGRWAVRLGASGANKHVLRSDGTSSGPGGAASVDEQGALTNPSLATGPGAQQGMNAGRGVFLGTRRHVGLRLGVVAPSAGALATDGASAVQAAGRAVAVTNASGGVAGAPVQLVTLSPADLANPQRWRASVDVLVGGFGDGPTGAVSPVSAAAVAAAGIPWLLPADPDLATPNVIGAELNPADVGARLGANLRARGLDGPIGVVVGSNPAWAEVALSSGLAGYGPVITAGANDDPLPQAPGKSGSSGPTSTEPGSGSTTAGRDNRDSCAAAIGSLRDHGAIALAVAGSPDLARRCAAAAQAADWHPKGGLLLAPSAIYAGLEHGSGLTGARSVLAMPLASGSRSGAKRFRAVSGEDDERALCTFAAVDLAVTVARATDVRSVVVKTVIGGVWRDDLVSLDHGNPTAARLVIDTPSGWSDTR